MSYLPTGGPPIIIARRGYGVRTPTGLGATQQYLAESGVRPITPAAPAKPSEPSIFDKVLGFAKDAAGNLIKTYGQQQQTVGQQQAYQQLQQPRAPAWMTPAALGLAAVGVILVLRTGKR